MLQELLEGLAMLLDERGVALYNQTDGARNSIFLEGLPERAEHALSLTVYGGEPWTVTFPAVESRPRVQVMARGDSRSPRWSRERSEAVFHVLNGFNGVLPNGVDIHHAFALQSAAAALGPNAAGHYEHSQNYELWAAYRPLVPLEE